MCAPDARNDNARVILMPPNIKTIRAKGHTFERQLAKYFRDKTGLIVQRTYQTQKFWDSTQGNEDLTGLPHLSVEAKRVERLDFPGAMRQAIKNCPKTSIPVVINRRNNQDMEESYVLLRLGDFTEIYLAWLGQASAATAASFSAAGPDKIIKLPSQGGSEQN